MATLKEDIKKQSDWTIQVFRSDGYNLDYSIHSLIEIDRFFHQNIIGGKPKRRGRLSRNFGGIVFSISGYIAETLVKNVPGAVLMTDDEDPQGEVNFSVEFLDGTVCWPAQRVIKRIQNGLEDGIYPYGMKLTEGIVDEPFDQGFWEIGKQVVENPKPWWMFW